MRPDNRGRAALILAAAVGGSLVILCIGAAIDIVTTGSLSPETGGVVGSAFAAALAVLGAFFGYKAATDRQPEPVAETVAEPVAVSDDAFLAELAELDEA